MTEITFIPTEQAIRDVLREIEKMRRGILSPHAITIEATRFSFSKGRFGGGGLKEKRVTGDLLAICPVLKENIESAKGLGDNRDLQIQIMLRVLKEFQLVRKGVDSLRQAFHLIDRLEAITDIGHPKSFTKALKKVQLKIESIQLQLLLNGTHNLDILTELEARVEKLEAQVKQHLAAPSFSEPTIDDVEPSTTVEPDTSPLTPEDAAEALEEWPKDDVEKSFSQLDAIIKKMKTEGLTEAPVGDIEPKIVRAYMITHDTRMRYDIVQHRIVDDE